MNTPISQKPHSDTGNENVHRELMQDLTPQELLDMKINQAIQQLEEIKELLLSLKTEEKK